MQGTAIPPRKDRPVKLRRPLPALMLAALLAAALLAPASSGAYVVGIGDQNPALFTNPYLQQLAPKRTRYITPYDSVLKDRASVDAWLGAAHAAHLEVLVAFSLPAGMKCPNLNGARGCKPVSGARYVKAFRAFHKRYPWVHDFQPWNEVNNLTQPTAHYPAAVVTYYQLARASCHRCTILGADIQDLPNMGSYIAQLLAIMRQRHVSIPRLWGVHNYTDTNRFVPDAQSSVRKLVKLLPGKIWLTETGGLFRFQPQSSPQTFRPDLRRQKRAMQAIFTQATHYRRKIDRVYLYQWFASAATNRWDSGVLDANGLPRPVYTVLQRYRGSFR
jgi:hypothetical protein